MKNLILIIISAVALVILGVLFIPREYDSEDFKEREGTAYWNLKTGSRIGYTKLESNQEIRKTPIIYLHGGPGGKITNQVIESLRSLTRLGHDLYFYDQIGSGHSERLKTITEYSVDRHRKDLKEVLDIIGSKKVILLGHSWGACLAINYLQYYPETVEKLIITGPGPILPINYKITNEKSPDSLSLMQPEYSNSQGNKKANNWRSRLMTKWAYYFNWKLVSDQEADAFFTYLNQELSKSTDCMLNERRIIEGGGGYYSHIMTYKSFQNVEDKRNELKSIKTPILILRGQCDNQRWGFTKEYLDIFTNAELSIIKGAGHSIINSEQDKYHDKIYVFLNDN